MSSNIVARCKNQKNIYGNVRAAETIVLELAEQPLVVVKKFIDIK